MYLNDNHPFLIFQSDHTLKMIVIPRNNTKNILGQQIVNWNWDWDG